MAEKIKIFCKYQKKAAELRREARSLARNMDEVEAAGISQKPCPRCGGEIFIFFFSSERTRVAKFISLDERYKGEADDFFRKRRMENPVLLQCKQCGGIGNKWEEIKNEEEEVKK